MIDDPAFLLVDTHHVETATQLVFSQFPKAVCISDGHCQGKYFRMCRIVSKSQYGRCKEEALIVGMCSQQENARGVTFPAFEQDMAIGVKWKVQRGRQQDQQCGQPWHVHDRETTFGKCRRRL